MKNIEEVLQSVKKTAPRRDISKSFTHAVIESINAKEEKETVFMKFHKKPIGALLSIALVVASGATTFAAVANWPSIVSVLTGEQLLQSGNRIVKIETEGCKPYAASDPGNKRISYYEIKKDSKLTNEKAIEMMRGICEEERAQSRVGEFVKQAGGAVNSTSICKIERITPDSITVVADEKYEGVRKGDRRTYSNIASDVKVSDGASALKFNELKVGDSVVLVIQDQRGISTETRGYTEDMSAMWVKAALKVPPLTGSPDLFYEFLGKDFVRVEPAKGGKGFERVYDFHQ